VPTPPPDNLDRSLTIADTDAPDQPHLSVAGDTYTILLTGQNTGGRYCLIDMYVPPGGGPPPHRHNFEESFTILEGEIEAIFRGKAITVRAGQSINIPANAPHQFQNKASLPARMLCICSPAGMDEFFAALGVPVATRTAPPPKLDPITQEAMRAKAAKLAAEYQTEFVEKA